MANPWQNAAGHWKNVGNWIVNGYSEMSGAMVPFSGIATITQDGEELTLDFDTVLDMGGNKVPFPHRGKWTKFDPVTQNFRSTSNLGPLGVFEGIGRVLPDCGVLWDQNPTMKTSRSAVAWSDNPNECNTLVTVLDEAGKSVSLMFMHLTRA